MPRKKNSPFVGQNYCVKENRRHKGGNFGNNSFNRQHDCGNCRGHRGSCRCCRSTIGPYKLPNAYVKNIRFVRSTADRGEPCMNLSFTFATSLLGCKIEYIRVPGYRLRSREFCFVDSSCAVGWLSDVFETSLGEREKSFSFACFPICEEPPTPVLEMCWRWKWPLTRRSQYIKLKRLS